ncbi:ornithine cyclodeaminase family protein [Aeromicrobium sp. YIM 150415]|uniref:ornithine cyclodeaminase family protein n=1 Tax=Aeromicrobium sp. YIM 150415 TaxID=2803912 RepID=UPI001962F176|nr:ornithine cyclodeaminase family protein [Aeromicrobium sp. YIM 150415]MBM9464524.1 ornithine cyclodeaminase family protein [Aeromicrobium sp. YIM 150415]
MTIHLDSDDIGRLCDEQIAFDAAEMALKAQRAGEEQLPPRIDVNVPTGFLRVMPAALGEYMGAKVMTVSRGVGNRYLLLVYVQETGELLATLDASEVTRLRTAATTALAGQLLHPGEVTRLGLVGTGFEAESHLRAFTRLWPLNEVRVFSTSAERRTEFARRMTAELGIDVIAVDDVSEACSTATVTVLCTKATTPVVDGSVFAPGGVVLSIGSTRPDLRELDVTTFGRARAVVVDDPVQVMAESGDVVAAVHAGMIGAESLISMAQWSHDSLNGGAGRDLLVFKSVGTAAQDLALGAVLIDSAREQGLGREIGEITELKGMMKTTLRGSA